MPKKKNPANEVVAKIKRDSQKLNRIYDGTWFDELEKKLWKDFRELGGKTNHKDKQNTIHAFYLPEKTSSKANLDLVRALKDMIAYREHKEAGRYVEAEISLFRSGLWLSPDSTNLHLQEIARKGGKSRKKYDKQDHLEWQRQADELWNSSPDLSIDAVSENIREYLENRGDQNLPAANTIRKHIRKS